MTVTLWHGDCLERMADIPSGSIDMILCDLPYGNGDRDKRASTAHWDKVLPVAHLWREYKRVLSRCGAAILTASQPFTSLLVCSNLEWFRCEWVWQKSVGCGFLNANKQPLKRHESILVFSARQPKYHPQLTQGKPYTSKRGAAGGMIHDQSVAGWVTTNLGSRYPTTILSFANETGLHPTQKPVALGEYLIRTYTNEGETVLDNCMGSGSFGVAAVNTDRDFIGIERDAGYFAIAEKRIQAAQSAARQLTLEIA